VQDFDFHLEKLVGQAAANGGWGYSSGQAIHLEPTCLALLALSLQADRYRSAIDLGRAVLQKAANPDGAYRFAGDREEAIWPTALVLFWQVTAEYPRDEIQRTASRILSCHGRKPDQAQTNEVHDIDFNLVGWPWAENNFSWVEPTSWACLALRKAGQGDNPRVQEGVRLLLDRAFDDGGINYGNRVVLGKRTEPIPGPTSMMLLALQGHGHESRVAASVGYLVKQALACEDLEHLCWSKLALDCHQDQPGVKEALPILDERIRAAYQARSQTGWLSPATLGEALTALALATERHNPFHLEINAVHKNGSTNGVQLRISPPPSARRKPWTQRLAAACRGLAIEAVGKLRQTPAQTAVHIARADDYNGDLAGILQRQYESFRERVTLTGKRVVLKPNLVEYHRNKVINTNPHVVAAAIELCKREGAAEVLVAEGPGHWRNVEYLVQASGLGDVLRHYKVTFKDLNHDEPLKSPNLGRLTGLES
jgi:hypothetical protein